MIRKPFQKITRKPGRRNNARKHGAYQVEAALKGVTTLDKRSRAFRAIAETKMKIAQDRGFATWDQVPRLLQGLINRAAHKDHQCLIFENMPSDQVSGKLLEHYFKWSESFRLLARDIGISRIARDISDLDMLRRQIEDGEEE